MEADPLVDKTVFGRYLLGQCLPEDLVDRLEERYFTDDFYFDRLLEEEDELIDLYLRGELEGDHRLQFETHFLGAARRREKLEVQRAIAGFFRSSRSPLRFARSLRRFFRSQSTLARTMIAVATSFVTLGVALLGWAYLATRDRELALQSRLAAVGTNSPGNLPNPTFTLDPGLVRSGHGNLLHVPSSGAITLGLHVDPPGFPDAALFVAALTTAEGEELWRQSRLPLRGGMVSVQIPSSAVPRGDYVLTLSAVSSGRRMALPSYVFRVEE